MVLSVELGILMVSVTASLKLIAEANSNGFVDVHKPWSSTPIKDHKRVLTQRHVISGSGLTLAYNRRGVLLGKYDPKSNRTTNRLGRLIGTGNLLSALN